MPLPALSAPREEIRKAEAALRTEERRIGRKIERHISFRTQEGRDRTQDRAAVRTPTRSKIEQKLETQKKKIEIQHPPLRAEERHPARRRSPLHPLLDREAADDRRGDAVRQGARAHHGGLCRSRRRGPDRRAWPRHRAGDRGAGRAGHRSGAAGAGRVRPAPSAGCCASAIPPPRWCRATPTACGACSAASLAASRRRRWCPACRCSPSRCTMRLRLLYEAFALMLPGAPFVQFT